MRTFQVTFIDGGNCPITVIEVKCNGFSEAIGEAIFQAGVKRGLDSKAPSVLEDLHQVDVRELQS